MGRRGPPPKPTALRILEGNPSKRPLNPNEPKPPVGVPDCPAHLDLDAKKEWTRLAPILDRLGMLTIVDGAALAAYCQMYSRWAKAERAIKKHGITMETENGTVRRPEVSIAREALHQMRQFAMEFGLTPASRSRVHGATPPLPNPAHGTHAKAKDKARFLRTT
jgi:P27 family predicted phage terminase small subunit